MVQEAGKGWKKEWCRGWVGGITRNVVGGATKEWCRRWIGAEQEMVPEVVRG